jgi:hypothetical protein
MGVFLELFISAEIGKEADDCDRRRGVIHGYFPAFSVMAWIKQRNTLLTGVKHPIVMNIHTENNKHQSQLNCLV